MLLTLSKRSTKARRSLGNPDRNRSSTLQGRGGEGMRRAVVHHQGGAHMIDKSAHAIQETRLRQMFSLRCGLKLQRMP